MRVPPNNADAEKSVLGCMMQDREALSLAFELLTADDFYQPANREIFDAMHALNTQGMPIDLVTVDDELTRRGTLEGVGGSNYLVELSQSMPSTVNARAYVQIVDEKATLRRMIKATSDIASACYEQTEAVSDILGVAEKSIFDIIMRRHEGSTLTHIADVLPDTYLRIEQLTELKGGIDGVPTGFVDLDNLLTGLHGGELVIVGARPSMGKTSFAMNIIGYAATMAGKTTAMFSLEMSREQLATRLLSSEACVENTRLVTGSLRETDWEKIAAAAGVLNRVDIRIDDNPMLSVADMNAKCRRIDSLGLVVIDYLQLMTSASGGRSGENRQQVVSEMSRMLKVMAKELNVPVICLSQLSRANEKRDDKRPMLSDLRESGAIEQDADIVMFLYRDDYYNEDSEKRNIAECIVAKNRHGETGKVELRWMPEYTTFATLENRYDEDD